MWTKTSAEPSSGWMKPKPLVALNHLTVPVAITNPFHGNTRSPPRECVAVFVPIFDGKFVRSTLHARITKVVQANIDKPIGRPVPAQSQIPVPAATSGRQAAPVIFAAPAPRGSTERARANRLRPAAR